MIQLKSYQRKAVSNMHNGCILCSGVGSGKSRTALAYYFKEMGGDLDAAGGSWMKNPKDLFIITTAKKRDSLEWDEEMGQFLLSTHPDICGYDVKVIVDSWNNIGKYKEVTDSFFIFDEDRVVGNGSWVKAFIKITKSNKWILLSATPGDNWSDYIPIFVANGFYKNRSEFLREHVIFARFLKFPKIDRYLGVPKLVRLRDRVLVDMEDFHRNTVSHHEDIYVTYDVSRYKEICKTRWNPWKDSPIENASEYCYTLRRIVNEDEARQIMVLELIEKHPKAIIFYNFDYELEILKCIAEENGLEHAEWNGHKHQEIPDGDRWLYLVQYNAGSDGWNCVKTNTIIFFSQSYSYRTMIQAAGRIDRMNTPYTDLYFYHLKSRAGIDMAISQALKRKKNFNEGKFYAGR